MSFRHPSRNVLFTYKQTHSSHPIYYRNVSILFPLSQTLFFFSACESFTNFSACRGRFEIVSVTRRQPSPTCVLERLSARARKGGGRQPWPPVALRKGVCACLFVRARASFYVRVCAPVWPELLSDSVSFPLRGMTRIFLGGVERME